MRNTFYTSDESTYAQIAAIAKPGWLIVVPSEEAAAKVRSLLRVFGQEPMSELIYNRPNMSADMARLNSVEVRTGTEIEQMDINEKMAMEVW